jgi:hypothetical protein
MSAPLLYVWNGEGFEPTPYYRRVAERQFQIGRVYRLEQVEARSWDSHRHYFAAVHDAWQNLPEGGPQFQSPDELRKWALTHTAFRDTREYRATNRQEALRVARYLREGHDYSRIEFDEDDPRIVRQYIPRSQAAATMSGREFQLSKQAVLDVLAAKLGVTVEDLKANAGRVA